MDDLFSTCCGAPALPGFSVDYDFQDNPIGMCANCLDHCEFEEEKE